MPIGSRPASIRVATVISVTNIGSQSPQQRNEQQTSGEASDPKRVREQKRFLLEPVPKKTTCMDLVSTVALPAR